MDSYMSPITCANHLIVWIVNCALDLGVTSNIVSMHLQVSFSNPDCPRNAHGTISILTPRCWREIGYSEVTWLSHRATFQERHVSLLLDKCTSQLSNIIIT